MIATPQNIACIGEGLDHPECLCIAPDGTIFTGGEAGQIYCIKPNGEQSQIASTGGFILGVALDGDGRVVACDMKRKAVVRIDQTGAIETLTTGTREQPITLPNYLVFDADGNLYVSDSGEYFHDTGTGCIFVVRPNGATELFHLGPFRFANGLAIDPPGRWLYVVESTAARVVRVSLLHRDGAIEVTHQLPPHTVPDGIAFASDGLLLIFCYRPDAIFVGHTDGRVELLIEDLTGELLARPTNGALHDGKLYIANLGGWHVAAMKTDMLPAPIHRPRN